MVLRDISYKLGRGQLPNPNECNSTLTSETRGETLTRNPNECHSTLTSETRGETLTRNPNECHSTLTSETRGETLTRNPNECHSTLTSAIKGIHPCLYCCRASARQRFLLISRARKFENSTSGCSLGRPIAHNIGIASS